MKMKVLADLQIYISVPLIQKINYHSNIMCCYHFLFVFVIVIFLFLCFFCFYNSVFNFHSSERETQNESSVLHSKNLQVCLNDELLTLYVNIISSQYVTIYNQYFDKKSNSSIPMIDELYH